METTDKKALMELFNTELHSRLDTSRIKDIAKAEKDTNTFLEKWKGQPKQLVLDILKYNGIYHKTNGKFFNLSCVSYNNDSDETVFCVSFFYFTENMYIAVVQNMTTNKYLACSYNYYEI